MGVVAEAEVGTDYRFEFDYPRAYFEYSPSFVGMRVRWLSWRGSVMPSGSANGGRCVGRRQN
ncbi:hypothetical protein GCM10023318_29580 [Nocardia callitridis]|uniref:Uncharacterized protein n=1 Tax=Nocardia callitridis TaxID=648753 RepID=A0ABP9KA96_9NOCA